MIQGKEQQVHSYTMKVPHTLEVKKLRQAHADATHDGTHYRPPV